jgi:glycosyltransferase involved in cell wall biosynthesis
LKVTTIIRTHEREKRLGICLKSIADCGYEDLHVIIISDNPKDPVEKVVDSIEWKHKLDWDRFQPNPQSWPPNDYFNQIHHLVKGQYITYIDDDDKVLDSNYYEEIKEAAKTNPNMIIWKANLGRLYTGSRDTIIPEPKNFNRRPVLSHFSTLNMGVKSDLAKTLKWPARKGGDGLFAAIFWDKYVGKNRENVVFINKVITSTQNGLSTHKRGRKR